MDLWKGFQKLLGFAPAENILTPYTEKRLQELYPTQYKAIMDSISQSQANSTTYLQQALNPVYALNQAAQNVITPVIVIVAVIAIIALFWAKRN